MLLLICRGIIGVLFCSVCSLLSRWFSLVCCGDVFVVVFLFCVGLLVVLGILVVVFGLVVFICVCSVWIWLVRVCLLVRCVLLVVSMVCVLVCSWCSLFRCLVWWLVLSVVFCFSVDSLVVRWFRCLWVFLMIVGVVFWFSVILV